MVSLFPSPLPLFSRTRGGSCPRPRPPSPSRTPPSPPAPGPSRSRPAGTTAARHPDTRWCYTALHPDGTAAAHACAPGPHPAGPPDPRTLKFSAVIRGPCDHAQAQAGYRPGRALRHLVTARNATCTAPGCGQPAARCDLDHTSPWHHGGLTCPCNLSPLCRHHHRVKQAQGWRLEQPEPGVPAMANPSRTHLHHHPHRLLDLAIPGRQAALVPSAGCETRCYLNNQAGSPRTDPKVAAGTRRVA